ncbi:hypothetical protein J41TS12_05810 [Paenibacillus antibioticophila]|uniref:Uncharacterized protein n=1 Tax=Paenibacillus antibioticophila TaxID=1274374 RepID=A0A919XSN6_9BACL|nr:hypothetical protein [Paenibacillus antibioticophila]GIO35720.1 hypothetical protein J41TS12_05810 [Paenibacillus antibioticophila]
MRKELQQHLLDRFPWAKAQPRIDNLWLRYGFDIGDGWYNLICDLFSEIEELYRAKGLEISLEFAQIKQKFGALTIYTYKTLPEVYDLIRKFQARSLEVCEKCADRGRLRKQVGWWITLCDSCFDRLSRKDCI